MNRSETSSNQTVALQRDSGLKIVLNGGSDEMESATIPIRWFFSNEIIIKQPTHILVIDLDEKVSTNPYNNSNAGVRRVFEVGNVAGFIQFNSPRNHRLAFLALKITGDGETREEILFELLKRNNIYSRSVCWNQFDKYVEGKERLLDINEGLEVLDYTIKEVSIPDIFFAKKSETAFGKFIWAWVNRWHRYAPSDQCEFRRRAIWAFTLQPILLLMGKILQYVVYAPLVSLYFAVAKIAVLFWGFRPTRFWEQLPSVWQWDFEPKYTDWKILLYGASSHGIWADYPESKDGPKYFVITGKSLILCGISFILLYVTFDVVRAMLVENSPRLFTLALITGLLGTFFSYLFLKSCFDKISDTKWFKNLKAQSWISHNRDTVQPETEEKKVGAVKPPSLYFEWLQVLSERHVPKRVDLGALPPAYKGRVVQKFKVAFWATKAKVCKPFAR